MLGIKEIIEYVCPKLSDFIQIIENEINSDDVVAKLINKNSDKNVDINNTHDSLYENESVDNSKFEFKFLDTLKQSLNFTYSLNSDFNQHYSNIVNNEHSVFYSNINDSVFSKLKFIKPFQEKNDKLNSIILLYSILKVIF